MFSPRDAPHLGPLRLPEDHPGLALARRAGLAVAIIIGVAIFLWFDRDGLRDNAHPDEVMDFVDVFYFTVVSLTTVGYGDIAPVTNEARLVNAILLTPIRVFLWALFLGTAYEITLLRLQLREERRMRELHQRLSGHVVVCGYGAKGRSIVAELLAHGQHPEDIVVIDPAEAAISHAVRNGLVGLQGDASSEELLRAADVEQAAYVLVAPSRDDAAVLICLTVRTLAPNVKIVAAAREEENIKLLYRAGVELVVASSVSGGRLMAAAVRQHAVPYFLEDLLSFGKGLGVAERIVRVGEAGRLASELPDLADALVIGVARGEERWTFEQLRHVRLEPNDVVVYLTSTPRDSHAPSA